MLELFQGVFNRFNSSDGATFKALINGRMFNTFPPQGTDLPCVVVSLTSNTPDGTFTEDWENALLQFSVFSDSSSGIEVNNIFKALDSLYHKQPLTVSGYSTLYMRREHSHLTHEEAEGFATWQYIVEYRVLLERV